MICYWPGLSMSHKYGIATVRTLEENEDNGITERTFEVSNKSKKVSRRRIRRVHGAGVLVADGWELLQVNIA